MSTGSQAERLDRAVDQLLAGSRPAADPSIEPLLDAAALVRAAIPPIPAAETFESRVLGRIAVTRRTPSAVGALERIARRELRHPGRIIAAGAVWRSRRHAAGLAAAGRK
jgi:hypothetical protein